MAPFEENCPVPSTHERCVEARYFLIQCLINYHLPQPFLHNLNAFIQSFRNITFMLQSEASESEAFKAWYAIKQKEMKSIPPLRRFVDARNIVVKQSSLTSKSKVACGLFRGRRMKLSMNADIEPFAETSKILEFTAEFVGKLFLGGKHEQVGEQAGVERVWVVEELGEGEVISKCVEAMNYMLALVEEAHHILGGASGFKGISVEMQDFNVLLESDVDSTLPAKWGWIEV